MRQLSINCSIQIKSIKSMPFILLQSTRLKFYKYITHSLMLYDDTYCFNIFDSVFIKTQKKVH